MRFIFFLYCLSFMFWLGASLSPRQEIFKNFPVIPIAVDLSNRSLYFILVFQRQYQNFNAYLNQLALGLSQLLAFPACQSIRSSLLPVRILKQKSYHILHTTCQLFVVFRVRANVDMALEVLCMSATLGYVLLLHLLYTFIHPRPQIACLSGMLVSGEEKSSLCTFFCVCGAGD